MAGGCVWTGVAVCVGVAVWVGDDVGLICAATDATELGVIGVGDLDPPAAAPMISRTSKPTDTPETERTLPRCVVGLFHANWYALKIR